MEQMRIEKAERADLERLMEMYAGARKFMAEHGNPNQWGTAYPGREMIEQDMEHGYTYVCKVGNFIAATFYYRLGEDSSYKEISGGSWLNEAPYGVVHRITSDGSVRGAASFCLDWALRQCGNLKIDTHRDNTVMQNLLKKNGFTYCGIIHVEDGSERLAYQKTDSEK